MRCIWIVVLALVILCPGIPVFGQSQRRPWIGLAVGVPLTGDVQPSSETLPLYTGEVTRKFDFRSVAGVVVEAPIRERLSLEVDGFYRRLRYQNDPSVVVTWEIPVLVKYRLSARALVPFIEVGPSFRVASNLNSTNPSQYGTTVGVGQDIRMRRFKIAPAVRYTRWVADGPQRTSPPILTRLNQVELLVGISF
jgi:hypothetical protein